MIDDEGLQICTRHAPDYVCIVRVGHWRVNY